MPGAQLTIRKRRAAGPIPELIAAGLAAAPGRRHARAFLASCPVLTTFSTPIACNIRTPHARIALPRGITDLIAPRGSGPIISVATPPLASLLFGIRSRLYRIDPQEGTHTFLCRSRINTLRGLPDAGRRTTCATLAANER